MISHQLVWIVERYRFYFGPSHKGFGFHIHIFVIGIGSNMFWPMVLNLWLWGWQQLVWPWFCFSALRSATLGLALVWKCKPKLLFHKDFNTFCVDLIYFTFITRLIHEYISSILLIFISLVFIFHQICLASRKQLESQARSQTPFSNPMIAQPTNHHPKHCPA